MSVDPIDDRVVPELAISRLGHPVALVREVEQARLDAAALQRGEHAHSLLDGDAIIELSLDHKSWGPEALNVRAGREFPVQLRILPIGAAELPLGEPELLGGAVFAGEIEDAVVGDEALEAIGMAGDPIDHIAAGCT